jgi:hypothetical protein
VVSGAEAEASGGATDLGGHGAACRRMARAEAGLAGGGRRSGDADEGRERELHASIRSVRVRVCGSAAGREERQ